ncbi:MAG TPA: hypothetical protein DIT18_07600 [Pseudomonas sp.]|nr:hypothetical protein [Pseudomonas sp.]
MIDRYISRYLSITAPAPLEGAYFDTAAKVIACAGQDEWGAAEFGLLAFLGKRVEISSCLYGSYLSSGRRASTELMGDAPSTLALLLLMKDMTRLVQARSFAEAAKRLNAVLKLLDFLRERSVDLEQDLVGFVQAAAGNFFTGYIRPSPPSATSVPLFAKGSGESTLPLTVLFWEGPIARAYLATLKDMGLVPERIIQLISAKDLASKKPVGRLLPHGLRLAYAQSRQRNSIHYWSGVLQRTEANLYRGMRKEVENAFGFSSEVIDDALALRDLKEYSANIEQLLVDDLGDERLLARLASLPDSQILFTGGGIVPKTLLELQHLKFIHVHPGFLPDVRGADCALWSQLMKGCTSATCFYMAPGLDDGDVIHPAWLPVLRFRTDTAAIEQKSLYRAVYAFFDPWVRATVLRQAILLSDGFTKIKATSQTEENSVTYHFMHELIQRAAFETLFQKVD